MTSYPRRRNRPCSWRRPLCRRPTWTHLCARCPRGRWTSSSMRLEDKGTACVKYHEYQQKTTARVINMSSVIRKRRTLFVLTFNLPYMLSHCCFGVVLSVWKSNLIWYSIYPNPLPVVFWPNGSFSLDLATCINSVHVIWSSHFLSYPTYFLYSFTVSLSHSQVWQGSKIIIISQRIRAQVAVAPDSSP